MVSKILTALSLSVSLVCANASSVFPREIELQEVTVSKGKEHYTKRNNPAVEFAKRLRNSRDISDPRRNDFYNYRKYQRISFGLDDFHRDSVDISAKPGKFDFINEHIDSCEITGKTILPLSVKEKVTDVIYRRDPKAQKEYILGIQQAGIDDMADTHNMAKLLEDAFREIDLYQDDITLLGQRFVSPLSKIAPDFYKFYLTDTVAIDGAEHIELSFAPRNAASFGFTGRLYVQSTDTAMFVRRVKMNVPRAANLNFVDFLQIHQEFEKAPDGSRLKVLDDFYISLSVIPGTQGMYARRITASKDHNFEPSPHQELYDRFGDVYSDPLAYARNDAFWEAQRQVKRSVNEARIPTLLQRLRGVKLFYWCEKFLRLMVSGYIHTGKPSKFDIGPLNTFISGNTVEGVRLRFGGMTTANLSRRWFAKGYLAYGTRDEKFKYGAELEYSFINKDYHAREFPVRSVRISEKYDIDQIGQHYLFTNPDNVFLSPKRIPDKLITYQRQTRIDFTYELDNHLSFELGANLVGQHHGPFVPLRYGDGKNLGHFNQLQFSAQVRYAPNEKFLQGKSMRVPINLDAPVIILSHVFAPKSLCGSPFGLNKTELSLQKRLWLSAFGYVDALVKGGIVWGHTSWLGLLIPNANLSYTIQPESFALMDPMEFVNDRFVSWDVTYWANGALFNLIPGWKSLKLREVVAFRGWLGSLSDKNNPSLHPASLLAFPALAHVTPMHGRPYMELSAGIDNIFRILRLDYVWRLTYRNPGFPKGGLRLALHFSF